MGKVQCISNRVIMICDEEMQFGKHRDRGVPRFTNKVETHAGKEHCTQHTMYLDGCIVMFLNS